MKLNLIENLPRGWSGGDIILVRGELPAGVATEDASVVKEGVAQFVAHTVLDVERFSVPVELAPCENAPDLFYAGSPLGAWYIDRKLVMIAEQATGLHAGRWRITNPYRTHLPGKAPVVFGLVDHQDKCMALVGPHRGPQHDPLAAPTDTAISL